jgi:hypothetical protein
MNVTLIPIKAHKAFCAFQALATTVMLAVFGWLAYSDYPIKVAIWQRSRVNAWLSGVALWEFSIAMLLVAAIAGLTGKWKYAGDLYAR